MATHTELFASSRRSTPYGLVLAGAIFFLVGIGGSGALASAYMGEATQALATLS